MRQAYKNRPLLTPYPAKGCGTVWGLCESTQSVIVRGMVSSVTNAGKKRPGLKPGQRHAGSFGSPERGLAGATDPVKANAARWGKDRRTVVAMAQQARPEAFDTIVAIMRDEKVEAPTRLRAGELILAYSDGKPRQQLDISIGQARDVGTLSREQLEAIAAGAPPPFAITHQGAIIEGELAGAAGCEPVARPATKQRKQRAASA